MFAVAHMDFYNNDLQIKIIEAKSWKDAVVKAFPEMKWLESEDLEKAKEEAFNGDVLFNVAEITKVAQC